MRSTSLIFATLLSALIFNSCKKTAGEGGNSSIKGKLWAEDWNKEFTIKNGEYSATDEDVYIIYGDGISYSDKTKTNYNGEFEFKYLRKGKYTIYFYTKDKTLQSQSGDTSVVKEVEINSKKQSIDLGQMTIYK